MKIGGFVITALLGAQAAAKGAAAKGCTVKKEDWLGAIGKSFKTDNPKEFGEYFVAIQEGENNFCTLGKKSKKNCYKLEGKKLTHNENNGITATLEDNGDITWPHGWTSRIVDNCPKAGECTRNVFEKLVGQKMRSWHSGDEWKSSVETFDFIKKDGKFCTNGTKSNLNCYNVKGDRLVHDKMPWVSSTLKANGVLVWSHGYRSAQVEGKCAVPAKVFVDPYKPSCKLGWEDWEGAIATSFKTGGKPEKVVDVVLLTRESEEKWCGRGTESGFNCVKQVGNKLVHKDATGTLQSNGDIQWTHGYTTRLWNTCREESCNATFADMQKMSFETWHSWEADRIIVDKFELHHEHDNVYCTYGDKSGRQCYYRDGKRLIHNEHSYIKGLLRPSGDISWSNGYTSRPASNPCTECKVSFEDWVGQKGESFKTDDPDQKIAETFTITEEGDQWWEKRWCITGTESKKNCFKVTNERVITLEKEGQGKKEFWGWIAGNGQIDWQNGYSSRLVKNPCEKKKEVEVVYAEPEIEVQYEYPSFLLESARDEDYSGSD